MSSSSTRARYIEFCPGVHARVRGRGKERLLWIHGYTLDSSLWSDLWDRLPGYSHIGIDMPGHGRSPPLVEGQTLAALGEALARAAVEHNVRHVIGLSLGSVLATQIVLSRPRYFTSLSLGAPALGGGPVDPGVGRRYQQLQALYAALGPGPWMRDLWMSSPPRLFFHAMRSATLAQRLVKVVGRHRWFELTNYGVNHFATELQPLEALATIEARTLVLIGERDFPAFHRTASILRRAIPRCVKHCLPGTGHLCMLEATDAAGQLIARHLAERG